MLPTTGSWTRGLDCPSRVFGDPGLGFGGDDYELYEGEEEFVLTVDHPGFEREEIDLAWDGGRLNVSAEHVDETRGRRRTYHRAFRLPKAIDEGDLTAHYRNGVLEVHLPTADAATTRGIPIEG
jgi:HSP20 family protein